MDEYEVRNERLRDEINLLQREKDHSTSQISSLQQRVGICFEDDFISFFLVG
jgi:chaperonin cofactor prefoldin